MDAVQSGVTFGSLGSILPEIILLIGGLFIMLLDAALGRDEDSGRGFMAIAVSFLVVGLVAVILQMEFRNPGTVLTVLEVDPFGVFAKIAVYIGMTLVAIAGGGHMNRRVLGRGEFWSLFLFVTLAMSFAVSANNLLMIVISIEFLSITSYILVGFGREDKYSIEAGIKYFLYGSVASAVMLYGISWLYGATGTLQLAEIAQAFAANEGIGLVIVPATLLVLVGLGFKASLAPFFQWAPDTYTGAPTPITAYLSTASKTVGFVVLARVLLVGFGAYDADWVPLLSGLSIITMFAGNLIALRQTNVKRMLAYSSVAQAGYMLMGLVAVVSQDMADVSQLAINGLNAMLIYLFAYIFTNIGAFLVVLAVEERMGGSEIQYYDGLSRRSPGLAWAMLIFMLSLTGIPATAGFVGKFFVFGAAVQHQYYFLAVMGVLNAGIAAFYYLNVVRAMFFAEPDPALEPVVHEGRLSVGAGVQVVVFACVLATIYIGLYPPDVIEWVNAASRQLLAAGL